MRSLTKNGRVKTGEVDMGRTKYLQLKDRGADPIVYMEYLELIG